MTASKSLAKVVRFPNNSVIKAAIDSQEEYLARKRGRLAAMKFAARFIDEKLFPEGSRFSVDDYGMTLYVPWSKENIGKARKAMGDGWKFFNQWKDDSGTLSRRYEMKIGDFTIEFSLIMDAQKLVEGACRRILVSEEVVPSSYTRKIYKVICDDGTETYETGDADQDMAIIIDAELNESSLY